MRPPMGAILLLTNGRKAGHAEDAHHMRKNLVTELKGKVLTCIQAKRNNPCSGTNGRYFDFTPTRSCTRSEITFSRSKIVYSSYS